MKQQVTEYFWIKRILPLIEIESSKFVSHRARMSGEFDPIKDSHSTKFKQELNT